MANSNFLSGFDQTTVGLSIKFIDLKEASDMVTFLDSARIQSPIYYYNTENIENYNGKKKETKIDKKEMEELKLKMTTDKVLTEFFIQNFILSICNFLIIMVGNLNRDDQLIIEKVKRLYMARTKIIIVHNFFNLTNLKEDIRFLFLSKRLPDKGNFSFSIFVTMFFLSTIKLFIQK